MADNATGTPGRMRTSRASRIQIQIRLHRTQSRLMKKIVLTSEELEKETAG